MAINNRCVSLTREQFLSHRHKRDSVFDYIYAIVRLLIIVVQNIYCVSSYLILSRIVIVPISWFRTDLYSRVENYLYNSLLFIVSSWSLAAGSVIVEAGDEYKKLIEQTDEQKTVTSESTRKKSQPKNRNGGTRNNKYTHINGVTQISSKQSTNKYIEQAFITNRNSKRNSHGPRRTKLCTAAANDLENQKSDLVIHDLDDTITNSDRSNSDEVETARTLTETINTKCNHIENYQNHNGLQNNGHIESHTNSLSLATRTDDTIHKSVIKQEFDRSPNIMPISQQPKLSQSPGLADTRKPRVLFLCNHISTADVPLMMQSFSSLTNQSVLWVLDAQFRPTNFGVVCSSHGDFFVEKNAYKDGSLCEQVLKYPDRNLLVLFPEGGFWRKRLEGSNRFAAKNNLPPTKYVIHPRYGAFRDLMDPSVGVTHIVDATLMYDDIRNPLSILDIGFGNKKEAVLLHHKVYDRSQIEPSEEWLRKIWFEKDKLLERYYEDRDSVYKMIDGTLRVLRQDWLKIIAVHLFHLLVCYLTIYRLFNATRLTMSRASELYHSNI